MHGRLGWQVQVLSQPGSPLQTSPFSQSALRVHVLPAGLVGAGAALADAGAALVGTVAAVAGSAAFAADPSVSGGGVLEPQAISEEETATNAKTCLIDMQA